MRSTAPFLFSVSLLAALTGCPDHNVIVDPPAPTAPMLASGVYSVQMTSVESWQCPGNRPNEIFREELRLALRIRGASANGDLEGLPMEGSAEPGFVYLDYVPDVVIMEGSETDGEDGDEDEPTDTRDHASGEDDGEDSGDEDDGDSVHGSAKCEVEEEEESMPEEDVAERRDGISLDLQAIDPHTANGILSVTIERCSFEVNVAAAWQGRYQKEEPVPVPDEPAEPGHGGGSTGGSTGGGREECGDDESDCG